MKFLKFLSGCKRYNTAMNIGTDIIQISRIEKALSQFGDKFTQRFLCEEEIKLVQKPASIAGFWAAKEAIAKALGCGIGRELSFHDIILSKDARGKPSFLLSPKAQNLHPIKESSLSISHDGGFAIAVVALSLDH